MSPPSSQQAPVALTAPALVLIKHAAPHSILLRVRSTLLVAALMSVDGDSEADVGKHLTVPCGARALAGVKVTAACKRTVPLDEANDVSDMMNRQPKAIPSTDRRVATLRCLHPVGRHVAPHSMGRTCCPCFPTLSCQRGKLWMSRAASAASAMR